MRATDDCPMNQAAPLALYFFRQFRAACMATIGTVCAFAMVCAHADSIKIGGTGTALGSIKLLAQEFNRLKPEAQLIITPSLGSTGAIRAVIAGAIDIGISARPASVEELRQGVSTRVYAKTPFVIASAAKTKVMGLTLTEVTAIYSGTQTHWPDGSQLRLVVRPDADADTVLLRAISPEMSQAISLALTRKGLRMADTDQDNIDALEKLPGSLGTSTLTQLATEGRAVKALALNGVAPTLQNLSTGSYPYFKTLHLVTGPKPAPLAKDFVSYIQSPAGQAVLARSGNLAPTQ
jgi:phosphate transport system substrate-binding protein